MFNKPFQPRQPKPKEQSSKCKITIKKKGDGTTTKEISGECSSQQLKALSDQEAD